MPWLKLRRTGRLTGGDAPGVALPLLLAATPLLVAGAAAAAVVVSPLPSSPGACDGDRRTSRRWSSAALLANRLLAGELDLARGVTGFALAKGIDLPRLGSPPPAPLALA